MTPNSCVSVIIPCYNRRKYIAEAIESVLAQREWVKELVVVDDGSHDGSWEIIQSYGNDPLIDLVFHENRGNRGQSASINLGLQRATGEFIAILDSDDLFATDKLKSQVTYLRNHPNIGMVYGQGHAIDAQGCFLYEVLPEDHTETGDPNHLLLDCYIALPGGTLVRRTVWERAGFFEEEFRAAQDHDMSLRLAEIGGIAYCPDLAFYYRKHDDSISCNALERRWRTGFQILRRASQRYAYLQSTVRKRSAVLHFRMGQTFLRERRMLGAMWHFGMAAYRDPKRAFKVLWGDERGRV